MNEPKHDCTHRRLIYINCLVTQPACLPLLTVIVVTNRRIKHALALYVGFV